MLFKLFGNDLRSRTKDIFKGIFNALLTIIIAFIVYLSGGVNFSYTHLMYIPILLTAYSFGLWQTITMAMFAGLLLGPLMPQDVATGLMQNTGTWLFRVFMFVVIGVVSSLLSLRVRRLQKLELDRLYTNTLTNYPNFNKLKYDIDKFIESNTPFSLLGFRIVNMNSIRQNISYDMGTKALKKALDLLSQYSIKYVYSIYSNEIAIILPTGNFEEAHEIGKKFLNKTSDFLIIDSYRIGLLINGSIIQYPEHIIDSNDAIKKVAMILDQTTNDFGLHEYDYEMEQKSKIQSELVPDLLQALKNDEFSLVYQPKIGINHETSYNVEALIRWNHPTKGIISPSLFIPIAEETGIISEVTKVVIKKVVNQGNLWKKDGMLIKTSINISHKDFNNKEFIDFFLQTITNSKIDASLIELEITEGGVIEKTESLILLFNDLRKIGVKISIDDFGTGYNSLIHLIQIPMDFLKIDKSFIDYITKKKYQLMIAQLIKIAHDIDVKVIAEGVETKEQLELLKQMDCDLVQGYYISKPLEPDALITFYKNRQKK